MVCGVSGTGRTTFVNTMCGDNVLDSEEAFDARSAHEERPVQVKTSYAEIEEEDGTRIGLTIVDTPGFGDNIDNDDSFGKIVNYLETQYDEVLAEESRIRRNPRFKDNRVHACVYFIEPTGHGLRELDIELMRKLGRKVNVVPCIGRADQLTQLELSSSKKMIMDDIHHHQIPIYNFPFDAEEDDEETIEENSHLRDMMPFAIVASTEWCEVDGEQVLARQYPWGIVEVENEDHSDFVPLRSALLGSHLADLKDLTHDFLYESYRTDKLSNNVENSRDSRLLNPEDLANQSYILKEEQLAREEEKLREIEQRVQKEISDKRLELSAREAELREIEARITRERSETPSMPASPMPEGAQQQQQQGRRPSNMSSYLDDAQSTMSTPPQQPLSSPPPPPPPLSSAGQSPNVNNLANSFDQTAISPSESRQGARFSYDNESVSNESAGGQRRASEMTTNSSIKHENY